MDKLAQLGADIGNLLTRFGGSYLNGIRNTLVLALIATFLGCVIGLVCGILNTIPYTKNDPMPKRFLLRLIRVLVRAYVEIFRGTPMVLQAVFIYYGLPYFTNNAMRFTNVWTAAILVVSINTGAYMAESVRGGIISIDPGQTEGAKAIGMNHVQTMTSVILPQALRNIMPQIGNNFIINIKDTSVMFIISFTEFFAAHRGAVGHGGDGGLPVHDPAGLGHPALAGKPHGRGGRLPTGPGGRPDHVGRHLFPPRQGHPLRRAEQGVPRWQERRALI